MEFGIRVSSLQQANQRIKHLSLISLGLVLVSILLSICLVTQSKIVILQSPGMINDAQIEKNAMDKGAQRAVLVAVTSNLAQINPSNYTYQKAFVQSFLSAEAYTKISKEIDFRVKQLTDQHELGSYYFIFKKYEYDPVMNKHFVQGDVHTVNAAKDSAEPYVFEYDMHIDNYRPVITSIALVKGEAIHDTTWYATQTQIGRASCRERVCQYV